MENLQGLLLALAVALALLAVLRWISGGTRRRYSAPRRTRASAETAVWSHVGVRRREAASTGR
jgi:hypothetical protein